MSWHEGERATVIVGLILSVLCLVLYYGVVSLTWDFSTLRTSEGIPLGRDFANYWAASRLALSGKAALAYNINDLHEVQQQALGTTHRFGSGWYYPPSFLLMVLPLGLMPYFPALVVWLGVTLVPYAIVLSRISSHPIVMPLCLFSPVMYENIMCGQNGYLSGALLGGGLLLLERRPFVAGCLMGILSYKPPLVILTFLTLIVGRCWKVLIGILTGSVFLVLVSTAVFGYQVWTAYFPVISIPLKYLELGQAPWNYTPSTFVAVLSAGFSARAAYLAQGVIMLVVLAGVVWGWRQQTALGIRASILVLGTLLFIPYGFMYELTMLVLPLAWLWEEGRLHGRLPGELLLLLLGWLMPFLAPILWNEINIFQGKLQIGPIIILALFFLALLKAKAAMNRSGT